MKNIFKVHKISPREDYFTAAFECVLNYLPALGQEIVNFLMTATGKESSKFVKAIDHPCFEGYQCYPDLLLVCENFDIICEHKLQTRLGNGQIESYLEIARNQKKPTYLALISNRHQLVSPVVQRSRQYLSSKGKPYFHWQDLYPIVADHPERLAQDFKELMADEFEMAPLTPILGWESLFDLESEQVELYRNIVAEAINPYFKYEQEAFCRKDGADRWGYWIKYPRGMDWLHLMYVYARSENSTPELNCDEPSIKATIWIPENHTYFDAFRNVKTVFQDRGITIHVEGYNPSGELCTPKGGKARAVVSYVADLNKILSPDLGKTRTAIEDFAIAVFEHAQKTIVGWV
jgi:hypothetical protein